MVRERITNYNNDTYRILNAKYVLLDNQDEIEKNLYIENYYTKLGHWEYGYDPALVKYLIRNMCLALYSKKQITNLFAQKKMNTIME